MFRAGPSFQPTNTADERFGTSSSPETILKLKELKRLLNKYHQYHTNPAAIMIWAVHYSINGDNNFLD
jgi:hypothetical protein